MAKEIKKEFHRTLIKHFRVSPKEDKTLKKKAQNHRTEADYIRSKVL